MTRSMFHTHNQFIIDITMSRSSGNFRQEQQLYDSYYNEILKLADAITNALYIYTIKYHIYYFSEV